TMDRKRTTVRYSRNVVDSCPVNKDGFRPRPWGRMHRMGHAKDAPLRADAQRNRERILEVAVAELTHSADTPLSVIAKKAGVGQGTLYRNFPSRKALILEIYRHEIQQVADNA